MADSFTPNLNLTKPEVGSSPDTWGDKTNADWDIVDGVFAATGTGTVVRRNAAGNAGVGPGIDIVGPVATTRFISWFTTTFRRWAFGVNNAAESGTNAGSDLALVRYDDSGSVIDAPITMARSTGIAIFASTPKVAPTNDIYHQGNLPAVIATVSEPIGTVKMYVGITDPAGGSYMLCDGRAISRTTYATLFGIISTTFGVGDGTTTFNIPNTAERVIVGKSNAQSLIPQYDARILGAAIGEGLHTLSANELAAHSHPITDPGHTHAFTYQQTNNNPGTGAAGVVARLSATGDNTAFTVPSHSTGIANTDSAGSGIGHNTVQPSLVLSFIIRVQ
jgi:microcystin-dependent protein